MKKKNVTLEKTLNLRNSNRSEIDGYCKRSQFFKFLLNPYNVQLTLKSIVLFTMHGR